MPEEILLAIFRECNYLTRVTISKTNCSFRRIVLDLVVHISSIFVLERLCESADFLSLSQSKYKYNHYNEAILKAGLGHHWTIVNWLLDRGFND